MLDLNRSTDIQIHFIGTSSLHSCSTQIEEIVYFSRDFRTTFIQYKSNITKSHRVNRCYTDAFIVLDLYRMNRISISLFKHFFNFFHSCEEIVYFSRDYRTTFFNTSSTMKSHRVNRCYTDAFIVLDVYRSTEFQIPF